MALYTKSSPKAAGAKPAPPQTTPDNKRAFDMRPKPSDSRRPEDARDRALRQPEAAPEKLLDADPGE